MNPMDHAALIEDIISTKNTLTILHKVFIVNQISLQPFSSIFDSITELIHILTHASVEQIETTLLSTGSQSIFNKLKDTLNELSDAITTKNTSIINLLNEQLSSSVQKFRIHSSYTANNEQTAEDIFKNNLLQSNIDTKTTFQPERSVAALSNLIDDIESEHCMLPTLEEKQKRSHVIDSFARFRFARRRSVPEASEEDENIAETIPPPLPPPSTALPPPRPSRLPGRISEPQASLPPTSVPLLSQPTIPHAVNELSFSKPRLMISYNHASKPLCTDIYNSLTKDGYDVWIDLKQMHGSTLAAMAQGIEDSDIILFCVTQNYSQSRNCQKEAEYAFVREKIMIPLLLESHYKPTGWLGLLMGTSLYIDFTKNDFIQNYARLKREIEINAPRISNNENGVPKLTLDPTTNGEAHTHTEARNLSLQSTKTDSVSIIKKSRGCVLV